LVFVGTHHDIPFSSSIQRNKENEPTTLNGTIAPTTRRLRDTSKNPYSKSYCKPLQKDPPLSAPPSRSSTNVTTKASTLQINEDSPTIKRILAASGCASVAELLARDQHNATSGSKAATNAATRASATNVSKSSSATNRSKSTTNGAKVSKSTNGSKTTNGSKSTNGAKSNANGSKSTSTNPKKKAKSKYSLDTLHSSTSKWCHSLNSFLQFKASNGSKSAPRNGSNNTSTKPLTNKKGNKGTKSTNGSNGKSIRMYSYVTLPIKKHCILLCMYSLTLPITFQFKFFYYHLANSSINLNFDPTNINITQVEQTFITLERRPASRRKSVVDSQVEGWAKWAMMNKTLYGNSKKTAAIRDMFGNTT